MDINYKDTKSFEKRDLEELFLSVNWSSGKYPEKLKIAMENCDTVYSAWDGSRLIGLINAMSDGAMNVYFHYMLVHTEYQKMGIGKKLVEMMLEKYKDYERKILIAYDEVLPFYEKCGFIVGEGKIPMFITTLTT